MACWKLLTGLAFLQICDAGNAKDRPHIIFALQDDLGWNTVGWNNPKMLSVSSNLSALAKDGIVMSNHLVHFHCSPTRRSFVSGRLPIHHGEGLSSNDADDIDLRWTLIGGKLQSQGYETHWVGKGHTGFKSVAHLPINRGFTSHLGFLGGSQSYTSSDRWSNDAPFNNSTYSTFLYGDRALEIVQNHPEGKPLFMYLAWQAVHSPYDTVPGYDCKTTEFEPYSGVYAQMLHAADDYVGRLVKLLQKRDMYKDTLLVFASDNGGVAWSGLMGNNFPLRGEKHGNWAGGYRVPSFVSGGYLPARVRGTRSNVRAHIVDWYPTFCALAGGSAADCSDDPPTSPLPIDPRSDFWPKLGANHTKCISNQHAVIDQSACQAEALAKNKLYYQYAVVDGQGQCNTVDSCSQPITGTEWNWKVFSSDIYGNSSYPGLDGVNIWPLLTSPVSSDYAAHPSLVVTAQVILRNEHKLLLGQGSVGDSGEKTRPSWGRHPGQPPTDGWHLANGSWLEASAVGWTCGLAYGPNAVYQPCLFDEDVDLREMKDLATASPDVVKAMWKELNASLLTQFKARSPAHLLGPCDKDCAVKHWKALGGTGDGPICGVPGCEKKLDQLRFV